MCGPGPGAQETESRGTGAQLRAGLPGSALCLGFNTGPLGQRRKKNLRNIHTGGYF